MSNIWKKSFSVRDTCRALLYLNIVHCGQTNHSYYIRRVHLSLYMGIRQFLFYIDTLIADWMFWVWTPVCRTQETCIVEPPQPEIDT
jgi:hypothetical protein